MQYIFIVSNNKYIVTYMQILFVATLICTNHIISVCNWEYKNPAMANTDTTNVLSGNAEFLNKFYTIISKNQGNVFFSPLSVHAALSMTYQGADGETAKQFANTLHVSDKQTAAKGYNNIMNLVNNIEHVTLYIANKIFIMENFPLKSEFEHSVTKLFLADVESINFEKNVEATDKINKWVESKTNSKIKDFILANMLDALSRLVLVNAIYFKGNWKYTFNEHFTSAKPFHVTSTDTVECQMMRIAGNFNFVASSELNAKVLELQYKSEGVSMIIVLPNNIDGITDLESKIPSVNLSDLIRSLSNCQVEVGVPRFKIEVSMRLNDALQKMGLETAFNDKKANFSKMSDNDEPLYISEVIQKAFIEVNEEGSEAAAVSGVFIKRPKSTRRIVVQTFLADHPFLFYVVFKHHDDNLINVIFSGRVMQFA